ncbi:MAG: hypothetical protein HPY53_01595 [Brevinematales bacterium]|nr:hypothetical protein [Brevinematales bacterium]
MVDFKMVQDGIEQERKRFQDIVENGEEELLNLLLERKIACIKISDVYFQTPNSDYEYEADYLFISKDEEGKKNLVLIGTENTEWGNGKDGILFYNLNLYEKTKALTFAINPDKLRVYDLVKDNDGVKVKYKLKEENIFRFEE